MPREERRNRPRRGPGPGPAPVAGRPGGPPTRHRTWVWGGAPFPGRPGRCPPGPGAARPEGAPGNGASPRGGPDQVVQPTRRPLQGAAPRGGPDFGRGLSPAARAKRGPLRALPVGLALHLAAGLLALDTAASFRADRLPTPAAHRVRLASLPPAASRLGDSTVSARRPEGDRPAAAVRVPPRPVLPAPATPPPADLAPLLETLETLDEVPVPSPAPEAAGEALTGPVRSSGVLGRPDGALGGLPGGVPGGSVLGLRGKGDPDLPPPDTPPRPLSMPRPRFPAEALRDGVRGSVVLRALITARGTVEVLRILRSVPGLDREAVRVVESEWRFRPAQLRGRPIPALSDLSVRFSLR